MKLGFIDKGNEFDFGRVSEQYSRFRDIYPESMYEKLIELGIGKPEQKILDLGSGTAVLPINMSDTGARFTATDISGKQVNFGRKLAYEKGIKNIEFKVCSAEDTGFTDNSFDVVTAVQCFHYFNAEKAAARFAVFLNRTDFYAKYLWTGFRMRTRRFTKWNSSYLNTTPNGMAADLKNTNSYSPIGQRKDSILMRLIPTTRSLSSQRDSGSAG